MRKVMDGKYIGSLVLALTSVLIFAAISIPVYSLAPGGPSFTVEISPSEINVEQGETATCDVILLSQVGNAGFVSLNIVELPQGVTGEFAEESLFLQAFSSNKTKLTLKVASDAPKGSTKITVEGSAVVDGTTITRSESATINIGEEATTTTTSPTTPTTTTTETTTTEPSQPADLTLPLITAAVAAVLLVIAAVVLKRRK